MPPNPLQRVYSNPIPAVSVESVVDAISHEAGRAKVKAVFDECTGSVVFEELVMKYAGKEIDKRSLGTFKFWATFVLTTIITGVITTLITLALTHK